MKVVSAPRTRRQISNSQSLGVADNDTKMEAVASGGAKAKLNVGFFLLGGAPKGSYTTYTNTERSNTGLNLAPTEGGKDDYSSTSDMTRSAYVQSGRESFRLPTLRVRSALLASNELERHMS